ncbi:MAG: hypothetical protein Q9218_006130 [Villophora microphyllina]
MARAPRKFKARRPFDETHFAKLPAELRDRIYRLALKVCVHPRTERYHPYFRPRHKYPGGDRKDGLIWYNPGGRRTTTRPSKWLGLLRVCRQMHQEAVHVWYNVNLIGFSSSTGFVNMCNNFPNRFQFLKNIRIRGVSGDPIFLMHALAKCTDLTHLTIHAMNGERGFSQHTHWISACHRPRIQEAVGQLRGLQSMAFLSWDFVVDEDGPVGLQLRSLQAPAWPPWQVDIADKIAAMMMRPKFVATDGQVEQAGKRKREDRVVEELEDECVVAAGSKRVCL